MVFAGEPYYLARESPSVSRIIPIHGDSTKQFDSTRILKLVAQAALPAALTETRVVTSYEAYYLDRHQQHPLPALFVRLDDATGLCSTSIRRRRGWSKRTAGDHA
jgi:CTP:molybdopterin cytidylyltransferase MocA